MFKSQVGFTVVEILIGIGLFGIVIPTIIFSVVGVNTINDKAADLTAANILAEKKFETLRNEGYNSISTGTTDFSSELGNSFGSPKSATYSVTNPTAGKKNIAINIQYTVSGSTKSLDYEMVISELGVAQ